MKVVILRIVVSREPVSAPPPPPTLVEYVFALQRRKVVNMKIMFMFQSGIQSCD